MANTAYFLLISAMLLTCRNQPELVQPTPVPPGSENIDILALGDSYTKGQSVAWQMNFPNQLADSLRREGLTVADPLIIAQTGWRTDQLKNAIDAESDILQDSTFSIVTLAIGVNNQYQHKPIDTYIVEFEALLQTALLRAGGRNSRVFVLSIPDYAYTPFGQGNSTISQQIDQFNMVNKTISQQYGVTYIDVTAVSREGLQKPELVATDDLHPSALQYTEWVKLLLPAVRAAIR